MLLLSAPTATSALSAAFTTATAVSPATIAAAAAVAAAALLVCALIVCHRRLGASATSTACPSAPGPRLHLPLLLSLLLLPSVSADPADTCIATTHVEDVLAFNSIIITLTALAEPPSDCRQPSCLTPAFSVTLQGHEFDPPCESRLCSGMLRSGPCQPPLEGTSTAELPPPPPHRVGLRPLQTPPAGHRATTAITSTAFIATVTASALHRCRRPLRQRRANAATTLQAFVRGLQTRRALHAVLRACAALQGVPGDHLRIHPSDLRSARVSGFCLAAQPPPVTVWFCDDDEALDIHALLRDATATASASAARIQAGVRGWFVRRSLLSNSALLAEIHHLACSWPIPVSPHCLTPPDLYLHRTASGLSWAYCERLPPGLTELNVIADALSLLAPHPPEAASSPLNPHRRASNARKRGKQLKAAERARRDSRVTRRDANGRGVLSRGGGLFRVWSSRWDRARHACLLRAQARADHERYCPYLSSEPIPPIPGSHALGPRDPYLLELSDRFGARIVGALRDSGRARPGLDDCCSDDDCTDDDNCSDDGAAEAWRECFNSDGSDDDDYRAFAASYI